MLSSIFGDLGSFIEDIVSYMITNESCTFQYYSNFMRNHPVMDKNIRDDTQISRLLKYNIKEQDINLFLRAWNQMNNTKSVSMLGMIAPISIRMHMELNWLIMDIQSR